MILEYILLALSIFGLFWFLDIIIIGIYKIFKKLWK